MKKINFFIVGAPKAGTTAMRDYLDQHPGIFMCDPKEPHYFSEDLESYRAAKNIDEYNSLFAEARDEHKILGDASVFYMYSDCAIKNVHDYNPEAKILVMLRDPVNLVHSFHAQLLFSRQEVIDDFEEAWNLCAERKKGMSIPRTCTEPKLLYYDEIGKFHQQLDNIYKYFNKDQVMVITFNDFISNTKDKFNEVLDFLDLSAEGVEVDFKVVNESKRYIFKSLGTATQRPPELLNKLVQGIKKTFGIKKFGLMNRIHEYNILHEKRKALSQEMKNKIYASYREEIENLEKDYSIKL
ncbi:MAG: sulfotransferase [Candidatus Thiodiazotropha sp. (ex Ctena orbiculata)]|uniref:Sulfotransferase n=1 Tax=Candidatus Thiodiazotropha taylori TaxID=2792791 RepID=A0A944MCJ7_9GAMM|nr:sulfotransferase [Candidatus Thiodiazotropha taylori]MBT3027672.1 sulfotransferase [Candidatus Thiodiazotropha taylori]MBT3035284.1 sulfotransferase [Candidatus Thiodiazotropha taylori]MBV2136786.1 sulfotransferase [Candidatus Thiodiazotropha taylori]